MGEEQMKQFHRHTRGKIELFLMCNGADKIATLNVLRKK